MTARTISGPAARKLLLAHVQARAVAGEIPANIDAALVIAFLETGTGSMPPLSWSRSADFAHMIDGYALCGSNGLGDAAAFADRKLDEANQAGGWVGSTLELWICLFLEHRRWRFSGIEPGTEQIKVLDQLCFTLSAGLRSVASAN